MIKVVTLIVVLLLSGCASQNIKHEQTAFETLAPRSILVVPIVNKSLDVDAPNYVLATLPVVLAEKGYYVFPVNTTKYVLEQEGLYEGDLIHQQDPATLAKLFDADAILYVTINRWDAKFALISTTVTVEFEYRMVGRDGTEFWKASQAMAYQPQNNNSGGGMVQLLAAAINAAIVRAAPNYMPLTQQANQQVFVLGPNAIPDGPYRVKVKE